MSHTIKVELEVVVERIEGKFASRDEIIDAVMEAVQSTNLEGESLTGLGADGASEYEIASAIVVDIK